MITSLSTPDSRNVPASDRDLERAADQLLEAAGLLGRRRGVYSEKRLTKKLSRETRKHVPSYTSRSPEETTYLVERWLDDLIDAGQLAAMEEICFRLRFDGRTPREIAADLHIPYRTVCRRLTSARKKLTVAYGQGPYVGWHEVYLAEVNRPIYRRPHSKLP